MPRRCVFGCFLIVSALLASSCGGDAEAQRHARVIGGPGPSNGRFITPRSLSAAAGRLWVVDRSGRLQCLDLEGNHLLTVQVPKPEGRGFPVGVTALGDGGCLLCDTHSSRVLRYDAEGSEVLRFGRFGKGDGEFTYPQRALLDAQGNVYVTEYGEGESNRVQVFDAQGRFLRKFGGFGSGPGQFTRCIGIALLDGELFIADTSDRVLVFGTTGEFKREFGRHGDGPGEFRYPYGICALDGALYVAEYGGHRVQKLSPAGECLGCFGEAGSGDGRFNGPWDVTTTDGRLYVADTGNHRVVEVDPAGAGWYLPG